MKYHRHLHLSLDLMLRVHFPLFYAHLVLSKSGHTLPHLAHFDVIRVLPQLHPHRPLLSAENAWTSADNRGCGVPSKRLERVTNCRMPGNSFSTLSNLAVLVSANAIFAARSRFFQVPALPTAIVCSKPRNT